jgi:hypothetical protein
VSQPCGTVLSLQPPKLRPPLLLAAPACQLTNYIPLAYNLAHVLNLGANLAAAKGTCGEAERIVSERSDEPLVGHDQ